ncbi:hypothetical protein EVAR_84005_1 [Eumeta japonica]|uniref:Uncharacterized protein n=1 Tax=Eumeta variegata TaxID=151549 RepID=A0A4C1X6Z3_EUMVA|nr:hypothetical protein EVAR_84005_1 [Eumeta japonica]
MIALICDDLRKRRPSMTTAEDNIAAQIETDKRVTYQQIWTRQVSKPTFLSAVQVPRIVKVSLMRVLYENKDKATGPFKLAAPG